MRGDRPALVKASGTAPLDESQCEWSSLASAEFADPQRGMTAATRKFPETATKLPAGGHENCPLTVMGAARHDVVCLTASRG